MDADLEATIQALIDRKRDLDERSAEYRFIIRQLTGLRCTREEAGGIIEDRHEICRVAPRVSQKSRPSAVAAIEGGCVV
jgi:hypothetical protein